MHIGISSEFLSGYRVNRVSCDHTVMYQGPLGSTYNTYEYQDDTLIFKITTSKKKSKTLSTWQEWKDGRTKQIDQFHMQNMFGNLIYPIVLTESSVILRPHW